MGDRFADMYADIVVHDLHDGFLVGSESRNDSRSWTACKTPEDVAATVLKLLCEQGSSGTVTRVTAGRGFGAPGGPIAQPQQPADCLKRSACDDYCADCNCWRRIRASRVQEEFAP